MHHTTGGNTPFATGDDTDLLAVCIDNGTEDIDSAEYLCETTVPAPKYHYERDISLVLMRGGFKKQTDQFVDTYGPDRGRVMVMSDETLAIGYYLQLLEIHALDEQSARDGLTNAVPDLFEAYENWCSALDTSDRRLRLLDQAEHDGQFHSIYEPVLNHDDARWRESGLTDQSRRRAVAAISRAETNPKFCYKNARRIVEEFWDDDDVQYVEGIALPSEAARITGHAWVEFGGRVAEVTWPWHQPDPSKRDAVYYGVELSRETIAEATGDLSPEEDTGPLLLDVDDLQQLG